VKIKRPEIFLDGIQVKSEEAFHRLCAAISVIEEQCGIKETTITLRGVFFCPWIDKARCTDTPMERLVLGLIERQDEKRRK
jgi:hypothetical protein